MKVTAMQNPNFLIRVLHISGIEKYSVTRKMVVD